MKQLQGILGGIWKVYAMIILSVTLTLMYPIYAFFLRKRSSYKYAFRILQGHTLFVLSVVGVFLKIEGKEHLKNLGPCVLTPNHSSYLDILILYRVVPEYFVFMGKHTLKTIPIFNIFFKDMNIAVNRKSSVSGKQALERCSEELQSGHGVTIFPEGTIPDDAPNLLRFKFGAFKLAIENQVPIVPITFLTNYKRLQLSSSLFSGKAGPGWSKVIVNKPIPTVGLTHEDLLALQERVHACILNNLKQHGCR
ncbi:MAG: 1-acyl-sn-glycerol-3-phosphate acyltransferase [Flavobacteriales bacterium]|nr:1-acyl-sn-glycerol-3-phosphate acyltransferase [Flavobacteriales bacterium]